MDKRNVTKVKDLIAELQKCDGEDLVVLSSDAEGNNYQTLYSINIDSYNFCNGEISRRGEYEGDRAVVLWP